MNWWSTLSALDQGAFILAIVFSCFFLWQLVAAVLGLSGGEHAEFDHGASGHDAADPDAGSFQILSIRSIAAFGTMAAWAVFLHHRSGSSESISIILGLVWGLAGGFLVALVMYWLKKLQEIPKNQLSACIGQEGTIYIEIPNNGLGQVRAVADGRMSFLAASSKDGRPLSAGTRVRICALTPPSTLVVEPL